MSKKIRKKTIVKGPTVGKEKKYLINQIDNILKHPELKDRHIENVMMTVQCDDGHIHHMVPGDEQATQDMIQDLLESEDLEIEEDIKEQKVEKTEEIVQGPIIFKNRQALGDILMMTCLHYASPVSLGDGSKRFIGPIINSKEKLEVQSYNFKTNQREPKKIINWIKNDFKEEDWIFLSYERASSWGKSGKDKCHGIYLTPDHEVFTENGKKEVRELFSGERILVDERKFNDKQIEVFIGTMLGDACLKQCKKLSYRKTRGKFLLGHSVKQKEWAFLKAKCLEVSNWGEEKNGKRIGGYTESSAFLGIQFDRWYRKGPARKVLPKRLSEKYFSYLTLVTWYLDDGSLKNGNAATFCSESFTKLENERLIGILKNKFNLKSNITMYNRNGKKFYRIYIGNGTNGEGSADRFFKKITPYVFKSMRHKVPSKFHSIKFDKSLWNVGNSLSYYAKSIVLKRIPPVSNASAKKSYCLGVQDNENFIVNKIVVSNCAIRDFKKEFPDWPISVSSTAMHIWDNAPHLDRSLTEQNAKIVEIGPSWLTNASNRDDRHFANAFRISIEQKLNILFPQGPIKPDIWMSREEVEAPPLVEPPYWIIVAGEKGDWTAKTYPFNRWQEFVRKFPQVTFVQVGAKEHVHPDLDLPNVINFIGKTQSRETGIRDLINLFYHAEGSMGLVSFQMHLAAAFDMPCIVIAGAREPARFTRYPRHQYLCTDGCLPCASRNACWHCDLDKTCKNRIEEDGKRYPKCVDIINTEDVIRAFQQFYEGERLSFTEARKPTLPNPISRSIDTAKVVKKHKEKIDAVINEEQKPWNDKIKEWNFEWGGNEVTTKDWDFLLFVLKEYKINSVLEFGAGLSTLLFNDMGIKIVTFETYANKITKVQEINSICDIREWNGKKINLEEFKEFDLAFMDGPPNGKTREFSTKIASENAKFVIIHDENREWEKKWQDKYIKGNFDFVSKGGNRCAFWQKKSLLPELKGEDYLLTLECKSPKTVKSKSLKLFFQGRGDGGAEHSTTWIANKFIEMGWNVQYISNNEQPSGTFRRDGNNKVNFTNDLNEIAKPCDLLVLYTNDYIWEFGKDVVVNAFGGLQALRKVMCVNFRLGGIGKIPWTQDWDQYLFLNSSLEQSFISTYMKSKGDSFYLLRTKSMPPPTNLTEYYRQSPDYSGKLRLIRHSSQGDSKYPKNFNDMLENIIEEIPEIEIHLMPGPSFLDQNKFDGKVISHLRNQPSIVEYLPKYGNVFWYKLPEGYEDQGPKVIMESHAVGLPVIADNHSGAKDRVIEGTGILCNNFQEHIAAIKYFISEQAREMMGKKAKDHAKKEYNPEKWIKELIGE